MTFCHRSGFFHLTYDHFKVKFKFNLNCICLYLSCVFLTFHLFYQIWDFFFLQFKLSHIWLLSIQIFFFFCHISDFLLQLRFFCLTFMAFLLHLHLHSSKCNCIHTKIPFIYSAEKSKKRSDKHYIFTNYNVGLFMKKVRLVRNKLRIPRKTSELWDFNCFVPRWK